jgi:hypothetical protein
MMGSRPALRPLKVRKDIKLKVYGFTLRPLKVKTKTGRRGETAVTVWVCACVVCGGVWCAVYDAESLSLYLSF